MESNQNQPNPHYRPVHRPHQKMKFPLFGGGGSGGSRKRRPADDERTSDWGNDLYSKLIPLVVLSFIAYAVYDAFSGMGGPRRNIVERPEDIQEQVWNNAKVTKKWAEVRPNSTRMLLELRGADGQKQLLDLNGETSKFWDRVEVRNLLTKPAGSLDVKVNAYARDTTLTMRF